LIEPPVWGLQVPAAPSEGARRRGSIAAQKEVADARKKKKAEEAQRKHEKEMEIARRVWARENRSDVKSEIESKDPIELGDDMIFSEEEED